MKDGGKGGRIAEKDEGGRMKDEENGPSAAGRTKCPWRAAPCTLHPSAFILHPFPELTRRLVWCIDEHAIAGREAIRGGAAESDARTDYEHDHP